MDSRKKKSQKSAKENNITNTVKTEESKVQNTETTSEETKEQHPEAVSEETKEQRPKEIPEEKREQNTEKDIEGKGAPEIQEIKIIETSSAETEEVLQKQKKSFGFVEITFGILMLVAVVVLGICLYRTSADLRSIQTFSDGLQTKLTITETRLDTLSSALGNVQLPEENTETGESTDELSDPTVTQKPKATKSPRPTPVPEVYTVCIDAGHGAHDSGAVLTSEDGTVRCEKDDNLWLATLVKNELETYGVKILMTREDDSFLELYDRTLLANEMDVDALISFHRNAYYQGGKMSGKVGGVEIWIHSSLPTRDRQLANRMLDAILEVGGMADRGVKYGSMSDFNEDYAINRRALMPSMIVEMGFISNEADNAAFDANGEAYAKVIAAEIYEWLQQEEPNASNK